MAFYCKTTERNTRPWGPQPMVNTFYKQHLCVLSKTFMHNPFFGSRKQASLQRFNLFIPITYGILTFRQLRGRGKGGGGLFGPDLENKVTVNGLI